jgi:hypothetical protein
VHQHVGLDERTAALRSLGQLAISCGRVPAPAPATWQHCRHPSNPSRFVPGSARIFPPRLLHS